MTPALRRRLATAVAAALLGGCGVAAAASAAPPPPPPPDETIVALLQQRIAAGRAAGFAVVIVEPGRVRQIVAGHADPRAGRAIDRRTRFELGSITKPLSATLAARLAGQGRLSLDDPIVRWLPGFGGGPPGPAAAVRVQDLVTHRSGLPRLPMSAAAWWSMLADPDDPYARIDRADIDAYLAGWTAPAVLPAEVAYSNLGYAVLGRVLETAAGQPYAQLLAEQLLRPAGLERAGIERRDGDAVGSRGGRPVPSWTLGEFAAAGGLRADADDVARLLQVLLRPGAPFAPQDLEPRAPLRAGVPLDSSADRIALGWIVRGPAGGETVWHNGGTGGFSAWLGFSPSRGVGVAVLASGDESVDDLGWHLIDPRHPLAAPGERARSPLERWIPPMAGLLVVAHAAWLVPPAPGRWGALRRAAGLQRPPSRRQTALGLLALAGWLAWMFGLEVWHGWPGGLRVLIGAAGAGVAALVWSRSVVAAGAPAPGAGAAGRAGRVAAVAGAALPWLLAAWVWIGPPGAGA